MSHELKHARDHKSQIKNIHKVYRSISRDSEINEIQVCPREPIPIRSMQIVQAHFSR